MMPPFTTTGDQGMGRQLRRTWIIEPVKDEDGFGRSDRARLRELMGDLEGTLNAFGGKVLIVADRVRFGVIPKQGEEPEFPLAETLGYIVEYDESVPLMDESRTAALAQLADDELVEREHGAGARAGAAAPEDDDGLEDHPLAEPVAAGEVDEHTPEPAPAVTA